MPTPKEIIDKVVFGGLYKVKSGTWDMDPCGWCVNDQCYCLAVPVMDDKDNLWMQDTYQLERPSYKNGESATDAAIREICSFGEGYSGWCVKRAVSDYYYKNQMKIITEYDLSHFEFICDLHDYRAITMCEDYRDYNKEDVIHNVPLFFEHGYDWGSGRAKGVTLIKKDAEKNQALILERTIDDVCSDFRWPSGSWRMDNIDREEKICAEKGCLTDELRDKAEAVRRLNEKLDEMSREFNSMFSDLMGS